VVFVVLTIDQNVVMKSGYTFESNKTLLHLVVEDSAGCCWSKVEAFHSVYSFMCLEDAFLLCSLIQG